MPTPAFYIPRPSSTRRVDLQQVDALNFEPFAGGELVHGYGPARGVYLGDRFPVEISGLVDATAHPITLDGLRNMGAHLRAGGYVGFTMDRTRAWASPLTSAVSEGDSSAITATNAWSAWEPSAVAPLVGERLAFDPVAPSPGYEAFTVIARPPSAPGVETFSISPTYYGHASGDLVRAIDFWPALYLRTGDEDGVILVSEVRNMVYRFTFRLFYCPNAEAPAGD